MGAEHAAGTWTAGWATPPPTGLVRTIRLWSNETGTYTRDGLSRESHELTTTGHDAGGSFVNADSKV